MKISIKAIIVMISTVLVLSACSMPSKLATDVNENPIVNEPETTEIVVGEIQDEVAEEKAEIEDVDQTTAQEPSESSEILAVGDLSAQEVADLLYMREEEKLARDVYLTLYDQWGLNIFNNIAGSEQNHTDSVKSMLENYGVTDIIQNDERGVFVNEELQALYDELVEKGGASLAEALKVGGLVEEVDILDLEKAIGQTDKADIKLMYQNLLKASLNHLSAFSSNYQNQTGLVYEPQLMTQEAFEEAISNSPRGGQGRGNRP